MLERAALRQSLALAIQGLSKQCSNVMRCYYVEDMKMHQIGKKLRVTEARVSQIHAQAIAELRAKMVDGTGAIPALKPRRSTRAQAEHRANTPQAPAAQ
jgi:RNA polymerase sigma factor for flagellar operon FliA